jgi:hypothetical protein
MSRWMPYQVCPYCHRETPFKTRCPSYDAHVNECGMRQIKRQLKEKDQQIATLISLWHRREQSSTTPSITQPISGPTITEVAFDRPKVMSKRPDVDVEQCVHNMNIYFQEMDSNIIPRTFKDFKSRVLSQILNGYGGDHYGGVVSELLSGTDPVRRKDAYRFLIHISRIIRGKLKGKGIGEMKRKLVSFEDECQHLSEVETVQDRIQMFIDMEKRSSRYLALPWTSTPTNMAIVTITDL